MTVVREREQTCEECPESLNWLIQRGFYSDMSIEDQIDINGFLLSPDYISGVSPAFFNNPVIDRIAQVASEHHKDQRRKAAPTHPYMKHVYMTSFQMGRLLEGGDLAQEMSSYVSYYGEVDISDEELAGSALVHDTLECDPHLARLQLYRNMVANGVPPDLAKSITSTSQFMIPIRKPLHLPPEQYLHFKVNDVKRFFSAKAYKRLRLSSLLTARLVKAADVLALGREIHDDIRKGREGANLQNPALFNAALETRIELIRRRLALFQTYDPANPFLDDIAAITYQAT